MSVIVQRYLLAATNAVPFNALASQTFQSQVFSAAVPLSGRWVIRLRRISGLIISLDNSGQISLQSIRLFWQWLNSAGTAFYSIDLLDGYITPNFAVPKLTGGVTPLIGDCNQVASSYDQGTTGFTVSVQAGFSLVGTNLDATNPHTFNMQLNAILELEPPGGFGD